MKSFFFQLERMVFLVALLAFLCFSGCGPAFKTIPRQPGWTERGIAAWYGKDYHGRATASGEIYDMYKLTAAHPSLPFGTIVRVTNLENKRSTVVRINDRGPLTRGRIIDLSYAAAKELEMVERGVVKVEVLVVKAPAE